MTPELPSPLSGRQGGSDRIQGRGGLDRGESIGESEFIIAKLNSDDVWIGKTIIGPRVSVN